MTVVLHMSDPHFGTEQPMVVEALARLIQSEAPDLVIISGDITQRATRGQFCAANRFLARFNAPAKLVIPGNHDIPLFNLPARLLAPYARFRQAFGTNLEPVHDHPQLLAIGVNTTRRYRHVDGEVSIAQVERVAARLELASPTQLRIVVTHQPIYVTHPEDEKNILHGREEAIRQWATAGVDLILGGHIHRPFACKLPERLTGVARPVWVIQAGTAVSWRIRNDAGNSVNMIRYRGAVSKRSCTFERWDYVQSSQAFMLVEIQEINGSTPDLRQHSS